MKLKFKIPPLAAQFKKMNKADKDKLNLAAIIIGAAVTSLFCLGGVKGLLSQAAYQSKVLKARSGALKQLNDDKAALSTLNSQYENVFQGKDPANIIGGRNDPSPTAVPPNGDNTTIVLDALPVNYDFPALLASISKLMANNNIAGPSIGGSDQSGGSETPASSAPQPTPVPLTLGGTSSYGNIRNFIRDLERSIRPFDVTNLQLNGSGSTINFSLQVNTYYQGTKTLGITSQEVR